MRIKEVYHISVDKCRLIQFLRDCNVILSNINCPNCGSLMYSDFERMLFRCQHNFTQKKYKKHKTLKNKCYTSLSFFHNSWFTNSKISIVSKFDTIASYIHHDKYTIKDLAYENKLSMKTVSLIVARVNELLGMWIADCNRVKLGGLNVSIEIDELCYGGKKLKNGRKIKKQKEWVLGIRERITGRTIVVVVPNRKADTLIHYIELYVKKGSVIHTDCWRGYSRLEQLDFEHLCVNHQYFHVNRVNKAHIQTVERSWRELRRLVPKYGIRPGGLALKLNKFIFTHTIPKPSRIETFFNIMCNYCNPENQN